jgi:hypothetical protein
MSGPRIFWLIFFITFLGLGLVYAFGGLIVGPWIQLQVQNENFRQYVYQCPPDEMRLRFYSDPLRAYDGFTLNFASGKFEVEYGSTHEDPPGLFWGQPVRAVFSTITFPLLQPPPEFIDAALLGELRTQLSALPDAETPPLDWQHNKCWLTFELHGHLHIQCFLPGNAPAKLQTICQGVGFSPVFDYWNSLR